DKELREQISDILRHEVLLATGCTEPGAVALCVAKAVETLGGEPAAVKLRLSKNVFKNAMGVGIPGTGMIGLPIAVAMAVVHGDSKRGLEVLTMPEEQVDDAKRWLANHADIIDISVKDTSDKLYIECEAEGGTAGVFHRSVAVIAKRHTNFVFLKRDDQVLLDHKQGLFQEQDNDDNPGEDNKQRLELTARMVYDFATTAPLEELAFLKETVVYNDAASECGLEGMGLHTGQILMEQSRGDMVHTVVARTVAASDARMDGCTKPVYSNSGSGNQGICCTLPTYYYGKMKGCSDEQILRALTMSHLMSIYIKRGIGRLSALCGIVNATMGVSAALTYLEGGSFEQTGYAMKNMINTIAGMVCDGAKPSCALKMSVGLYSAFVCAELAVHGRVVDSTDGLSEADLDCSIRNLGRLGKDGMNQTDDMILDIMTHKRNA
ncbi:MAG: serine dehydratase subunit alpha family protein, partial [Bacteroidales bacterium]|nr:serine dehydratase subunit alpha family protein [Bacteroidales bacterium]